VARPLHGTAEIDGVTISLIPFSSERAGLNFGLVTVGVKRVVCLRRLRLKDLPKIDLILVSHAHMDHLDTPIFAQAGEPTHQFDHRPMPQGDLFRAGRYRQLTELRWGSRTSVGPLTVRGYRSQPLGSPDAH